MLAQFSVENLNTLWIITIIVSLAAGLYVAYLMWGRRYHRVMHAEADTAKLRGESERLRADQRRLKSRLSADSSA